MTVTNCHWLHKTSLLHSTLFIFRSGTKWLEERRKHGKLLIPANVLRYIPGFNRATDRLIRNIKELQDDEGYVNNVEDLITYWSLEGTLDSCWSMNWYLCISSLNKYLISKNRAYGVWKKLLLKGCCLVIV